MVVPGWRRLFAEVGTFLGGVPGTVRVTGDAADLSSRLPVEDAVAACVAVALTAAAGLQAQRNGLEPREVWVDAAHTAAAVRNEAHLHLNGRPLSVGFAPLSRFWRTADGWVRTHANYPWHRETLLRALGADADVGAVGSAIGERDAAMVEADVVDAGGVAAVVRTIEQWREYPQGRAVVCRCWNVRDVGDISFVLWCPVVVVPL
ncbi:MAG: hypothetical protein ACRDQY_20765 [Pseudonocardiaceae bacterium]